MLICDKRRPARARGYQYQAPPRGPNKDSPPGLRPAPRALLGVGRHAPRPPWAAPPGAPSRTGPLLPRPPSRRGSGHGCAGGGGGQPLAVVHARRLAPGGFRASGEISKRWAVRMHGGGFGGRAPRCRATVGNPAQAVGGQGAAACGCARRPRTGRGCPRATGFRAERLRHPVPARRRRSALPTENKRTIFLKMEKS